MTTTHLPCWGGNDNFRQLDSYERIVKVTAAFAGYMGLTESGRVVTCGPAHEFERCHEIERWQNPHFYDNYSDVVQVDCYNHYYGTDSSMILHSDGTVSSDTFEGVDSWRNIIQISVGADIAIGLKDNGTIEMVDNRGTRFEVNNWKNLACVVCKFFGVVGITKDGEILSLLAQP